MIIREVITFTSSQMNSYINELHHQSKKRKLELEKISKIGYNSTVNEMLSEEDIKYKLLQEILHRSSAQGKCSLCIPGSGKRIGQVGAHLKQRKNEKGCLQVESLQDECPLCIPGSDKKNGHVGTHQKQKRGRESIRKAEQQYRYLKNLKSLQLNRNLKLEEISALWKSIRWVAFSNLMSWFDDYSIRVPAKIKARCPSDHLLVPYMYFVYDREKRRKRTSQESLRRDTVNKNK